MSEIIYRRSVAVGLFGLAGAVGVFLLLFLSTPAGAVVGPFEWTVHDRVDNTSFAADPALPASAMKSGYEIVSFAAAPPSDGISQYEYGDLGVVTCTIEAASVDGTPTLLMTVEGAYPYSGCVYFLGVATLGDETQTFDLDLLPSLFTVMCDSPGCDASDIDVVFGGRTEAEVEEFCVPFNDGNPGDDGDWTKVDNHLYTVGGNTTVVCPMFITVAQSAFEGELYKVWLTPPDDETPSPETPEAAVSESTPIISSVGTGLAKPDSTGIAPLFTWVFVLLLVAGVTVLGLSTIRRPASAPASSTQPLPGVKGQRPSGRDDR